MSKRDKLISILMKKLNLHAYIDSFIEIPLNDHNYIIMFKKINFFYLLKLTRKKSFLWETVLRIYIIPIPIEYYISLLMKMTVIDILVHVLINQLLVIKKYSVQKKIF